MNKKAIAILIAAVTIIISLIAPLPEGLSSEGLRGLVLLLATIFLYTTEALPLVVTTLAAMALMPVLGIMPFSEVWPAFGNSAVFFMLASFGVSAAFQNTTLPTRITATMIRWSKGSILKICIGFVFCPAVVSALMSDIPSCTIFGALAVSLLESIGESDPKTSRFGKALMIAVPTGAILGGFATPAGNGLNVMVMQTVESIGGTPLTFLQWSKVGIPIVLIMVIVCSLWIKHFCRLENEHVETDALLKRLDTHEPLSRCDIKFMTILSIMVILWVVSSWVPALNITLIAIAGVFVMHLPGIQLLKGKEFLQGVSWETFIVCGGIIALGTGVQGTGAIQWVVNGVLGSVEGLPFVVILLALSIIPCVVHMITPAAGSIFALTCAPLVTAAIALNIDPCIAGLIVGIWVCITFTQPFDLVYLLTYSYGYYTSGELVRYGVLPTLLLLALSVTLLPALCLI